MKLVTLDNINNKETKEVAQLWLTCGQNACAHLDCILVYVPTILPTFLAFDTLNELRGSYLVGKTKIAAGLETVVGSNVA